MMMDREEMAEQNAAGASAARRAAHRLTPEDGPMEQVVEKFGEANANAPAALFQFAFLIGTWQGEAKVKSAIGEWQTFQVTWLGRFILDGYAIADEYRMTGSSEEVIVLGMNFRTYDAARQIWNFKWLNALAGAWMDLGSEEFGRVNLDGHSISHAFEEPVTTHTYTRATYTNVSRTHFTWRGERSDDRKVWSEFMVVEVSRSDK